MKLAPRYAGPTILTIAGAPNDQLQPFTRQRRRLLTMLADLSDEQWSVASRCKGWTVRDVAAHLAGVDAFWLGSMVAGLTGAPSRWLPGFDPAATPPVMVDQMDALSADEVLNQLVSATEPLLDAVAGLTDEQWCMTAESPVGHVPIRLMVQHALWDCWIHERDIAIPLGVAPTVMADEVTSCLQYAAAVSPAVGMGVGKAWMTTLAIEATDPAVRFVLDVGESVSVRDGPVEGLPCLRGDAVALVETLSLRAPMPSSTPSEWTSLLTGLATAFEARG
jgi:uncharacterized protein (TIGR03083 family)